MLTPVSEKDKVAADRLPARRFAGATTPDVLVERYSDQLVTTPPEAAGDQERPTDASPVDADSAGVPGSCTGPFGLDEIAAASA